MNSILWVLALTLPLVTISAQDAPKANPSPWKQYLALDQDFFAASKIRKKAMAEAKAEKDDEALKRLKAAPLELGFSARYEAGAKKFAGTDGAVPYLLWILTRCRFDHSKMEAAAETLVREHVKHKRIMVVTDMVYNLSPGLGRERAYQLLTRLYEHSGDTEIAASALFRRAQLFVGTRGVGATKTQRERAIADLHQVIKQTHDKRLKQRAQHAIDEENRLRVGQIAPEISGEDIDGVPFKLSDYRGKVVMLDFWGDW